MLTMSQFENPINITLLNNTFLDIQGICTTPLNTGTSSEPLTSGHMFTIQLYPTTIPTFSLLTLAVWWPGKDSSSQLSKNLLLWSHLQVQLRWRETDPTVNQSFSHVSILALITVLYTWYMYNKDDGVWQIARNTFRKQALRLKDYK
jgi:hypothetical protein